MVTSTHIENVEGDFMTVSGLWEETKTYSNAPSTDVAITRNSFRRSGRQGVSLVYVDRVLVTGNTAASGTSRPFGAGEHGAGGSTVPEGNRCPAGWCPERDSNPHALSDSGF